MLLLLLAVGLAAAFLTLAWFKDSLLLPGFLIHQPNGTTDSSLTIKVIPRDAIISINQRPYDPKSILVPGDYIIGVNADGYYPTEENVRVHRNESSQLIIRLMPIITMQAIAEDAAAPGWDQQGDLFFLNRSQGKIQKWASGKLSPGVDVVGEIYQILYLPDGTNAIVLAWEGVDIASKLYMINLQTGEKTDLPATGLASLGHDGKTIWGIYDDSGNDPSKPVWSLLPGGSLRQLSLDNPQLASYGEQLLVDPSGQWLVVEGTKGITVWEIASGKTMATFENASTPVWIQNPRPGLAYLNSDHSLNFAQAALNWSSIVLLTNIQNPITGMPGGSEIVFCRYNPFAGGTSLWAVDTATMGVRLLSEAKIESGRAEQIAISLDQKEIAFLNGKNELYLVVLEP
jgi:hypothetical protein